jgi:hypothetical protein
LSADARRKRQYYWLRIIASSGFERCETTTKRQRAPSALIWHNGAQSSAFFHLVALGNIDLWHFSGSKIVHSINILYLATVLFRLLLRGAGTRGGSGGSTAIALTDIDIDYFMVDGIKDW